MACPWNSPRSQSFYFSSIIFFVLTKLSAVSRYMYIPLACSEASQRIVCIPPPVCFSHANLQSDS